MGVVAIRGIWSPPYDRLLIKVLATQSAAPERLKGDRFFCESKYLLTWKDRLKRCEPSDGSDKVLNTMLLFCFGKNQKNNDLSI